MKRRIVILLLAAAAILAAGGFLLRRQSGTPSSGAAGGVATESYNPEMGEAVEVQTQCPEVSGLCLSPRGDGLLAASDESGVYHISWTGETEPFYVEKGWLDCEGVTMDPETKDVYYIVEGRQEVRRLKGPDYQESELICVIKDVGYRTNSGLEGITWYKDGTLLLGNQKHPSQLIRYSLTEGITGRWETGTSEIADLCYDPVRDVLWIADSDLHTINLCTLEGQIRRSYPMPFIDNGEGLYVDHEHGCIWIGDDTSSKLYRIPFQNL